MTNQLKASTSLCLYVGSILLFYPRGLKGFREGDSPWHATVCHKHGSSVFNIAGFDASGRPYAAENVVAFHTPNDSSVADLQDGAPVAFIYNRGPWIDYDDNARSGIPQTIHGLGIDDRPSIQTQFDFKTALILLQDGQVVSRDGLTGPCLVMEDGIVYRRNITDPSIRELCFPTQEEQDAKDWMMLVPNQPDPAGPGIIQKP